MSKRIVLCADGTWDSAENDTNVYKLFKGVLISFDQIAFYDDGVGSEGTPIEKLAGAAFGEGLFGKIKDGYTKIAHVYEAGDELFIFGFSRGAYTARSLAGMVAICGLPTAAFDDSLVSTAFQAYRDQAKRATLLAGLDKYAMFDAKIKMVGVWDTVGSLGIPAVVGKVDPLLCGFLDTGLHADVLNAYHALAIDERRREFPPTLWTAPATPVPGQVVEQAWFSGSHCDVGGGYPETGLSDIALSWMIGKAGALSLQFNADFLAQYGSLDAKYALDQLHGSWKLFWGFPKSRVIPDSSTLSNSVAIRCQHDDSYQPKNLTLSDGALASSYPLVQTVTPHAE